MIYIFQIPKISDSQNITMFYYVPAPDCQIFSILVSTTHDTPWIMLERHKNVEDLDTQELRCNINKNMMLCIFADTFFISVYSRNMFMKIYSKCFPAGKAEEFCAHMFRTFDSDNNGFIDFKEFLLAVDVTSAGSPEEKLNWAFK